MKQEYLSLVRKPKKNQGFLIRTEVWHYDLSLAQKNVIGVIESLSYKKHYCYASNEYIANALNMSEKYIQRCLLILEEKGYIKREFATNNGRKYRTGIIPLKLKFSTPTPSSFNTNAEGF